MISFTLATVIGLLSAVSAMPATPAGAHVPPSLPMPDIAAIMAKDPATFPTYPPGMVVRANTTSGPNNNGALSKRCAHGDYPAGGCCADTAQLTWGDADNGQWGVLITNGSPNTWEGFYFYENSCDYVPYKYIWIGPSATQFVTLPWNFQGRMTRGTDAMNLAGNPQLLGTWFEFNWQTDGSGIWGDISIIEGCDQGMLMWATDGSKTWRGFTQDILANAPVGAWAQKSDGNWCLDSPLRNAITDAYELTAVDYTMTYVDNAHGDPNFNSVNGRFGVYADPGLI